ncbi:DNA-binding protein [Lentilactobacillus fungorum]|uniref:DNA-binding protein n=1 Tax=Lentilactobacillus fungorum TaxID=2201250 RepID=A0ABQ3VW98_9LACO|nr:helix-turn-helix transcriptional regulator [Lentilactobacillus fungorum]GHP13188.1 DNA-binding protein [Lentilactobacillus fungorum]
MTKTRIASLRKQRGWTQEHLAEESQVNTRTIQRLEAGEDASLETLNLIANALNVQINDLFETLPDSDKGQEIMAFDKNKAEQTRKWEATRKLYRTCIVIGFIILMLLLATALSSTGNDMILDIGGIVWLIIWPIGFGIIKLIEVNWLEPQLSQKYPLAENLNLAYVQQKKGSPVTATKKHTVIWVIGGVILGILIVWAVFNLVLFKRFGI